MAEKLTSVDLPSVDQLPRLSVVQDERVTVTAEMAQILEGLGTDLYQAAKAVKEGEERVTTPMGVELGRHELFIDTDVVDNGDTKMALVILMSEKRPGRQGSFCVRMESDTDFNLAHRTVELRRQGHGTALLQVAESFTQAAAIDRGHNVDLNLDIGQWNVWQWLVDNGYDIRDLAVHDQLLADISTGNVFVGRNDYLYEKNTPASQQTGPVSSRVRRLQFYTSFSPRRVVDTA